MFSDSCALGLGILDISEILELKDIFGNFGTFGNFGDFGNPVWNFWNSVRYKGGHFGNFGNAYEVRVPFLDFMCAIQKHILQKYCFLYSMKPFPQADIAYSTRSCNPVVTMMLQPKVLGARPADRRD